MSYKPKFTNVVAPTNAIFLNTSKDEFLLAKEEYGSYLRYDSSCYKCWIENDCPIKNLILKQFKVVERDADLRTLIPEEDRLYFFVPFPKLNLIKSIGGAMYSKDKGNGIWYVNSKNEDKVAEILVHFNEV